MERGAWRAMVHEVTERLMWLKQLSAHAGRHLTYAEVHFFKKRQPLQLSTLRRSRQQDMMRRNNCSFALLNFTVWYWNTFLNKCSYIIHHFNGYFLLFFANDYWFIFILDYGNDVRQNVNSNNFLFQVQNRSSSRDNAQHQQHIWPRNCKWTYSAVVIQKFHKGDKSLEDKECSGWPSEVDNH